ncbi:unnamed protein product [Schistosoma rodhaini]|uniref:Glycoside hydrolase family 5 domain-containing protein n=1 Tax=Schistosoma rodhaini TaxID=6188 RepID=A0AA85G9E0_9TREM|nr:unnamed protein product [Schistosoma rodhaini]
MRLTRSSKQLERFGDSKNTPVNTLLRLSWIMILLLLKVLYSEARGKVTIDDDTGYFVDSNGFIKLFHGINCVHKVTPFYIPKLLDPHTFKVLRDWGINVIRLGFSWIALKPHENETNLEYIDTIEKIIDNAGLYGVYIIIDLHQDGLSKRLGAIDAVPYWFMDKIKRPPYLFQYPWPLKKYPNESAWFLTYATYESAHAFESIYKNVSGLWNYFAEYWRITTDRFGKKYNVLGYELINEPPPGNFYLNPFLLLPNIAGQNLLLFYDYLVNVIRQTDKDTLIFYESVTYGIYFPFVNGIPGTGMQRVPGLLQDKMARKKSVLSYHYYCWLLESTPATEHMPSWKQYLCDQLKSFSRTYPQSTAGQPVQLRFDVDSGVFYYAFVPTQKNCTNVNSTLLVAEIFVPMSIHYPHGVKTRFIPEQLYYKVYENNTNLIFVYMPCTLIKTNIELIEITIIPNQN